MQLPPIKGDELPLKRRRRFIDANGGGPGVRLRKRPRAIDLAFPPKTRAYPAGRREVSERVAPLALGAIPDVFVRAKSFIQKAEHATQTLYALCGFFFGNDLKAKGKWFDGVLDLIEERYGATGECAFAEKGARFCKFLRNARNCVEHQKPHQRIIVNDYNLLASGEWIGHHR